MTHGAIMLESYVIARLYTENHLWTRLSQVDAISIFGADCLFRTSLRDLTRKITSKRDSAKSKQSHHLEQIASDLNLSGNLKLEFKTSQWRMAQLPNTPWCKTKRRSCLTVNLAAKILTVFPTCFLPPLRSVFRVRRELRWFGYLEF